MICTQHNAKVIQTDWPGFVEQKNRGFDYVSGQWVLFLDADEVVSPSLATEIKQTISMDNNIAGYRFYRVNWWQDKPLYHGRTQTQTHLKHSVCLLSARTGK